MFDTLLSAPYVPFAFALTLLLGLLVLEIVFAVMGGTLLGSDPDGIDGPDIDVDAPDIGDLDLDLDGIEIDPDVFELADLAEAEVDAPANAGSLGALTAWLGFGRMPAMIWLAVMLMAFGLSGITLQSLAEGLLGRPVGPWPAGLVAGGIAIWFTRGFGALFARLLPRTETSALSERHLGRRTGVITQGTAARGRPAEVRVTDRYGNLHYLRAEPLRDDAEIPQGTEVLVLRHKLNDGYRLVALSA